MSCKKRKICWQKRKIFCKKEWIYFLKTPLIISILFASFVITWALNYSWPNLIKDTVSESAVDEIHGFFYFLSGIGTILLVYVAYMQIGPINKTAKAEFLLRIDKRWNSKKITETRKKLWKEYRLVKKDYKLSCNRAKKLHGIKKVGEHIVSVHEDDAQIDLLFDYLNFIELLGSINYIREKDLIGEGFIKSLFGGKLKTYVEFYEEYFKLKFKCKYDTDEPNARDKCLNCYEAFKEVGYCKETCPQAAKLLTHFKNNPERIC